MPDEMLLKTGLGALLMFSNVLAAGAQTHRLPTQSVGDGKNQSQTDMCITVKSTVECIIDWLQFIQARKPKKCGRHLKVSNH